MIQHIRDIMPDFLAALSGHGHTASPSLDCWIEAQGTSDDGSVKIDERRWTGPVTEAGLVGWLEELGGADRFLLIVSGTVTASALDRVTRDEKMRSKVAVVWLGVEDCFGPEIRPVALDMSEGHVLTAAFAEALAVHGYLLQWVTQAYRGGADEGADDAID